MGLLSALQFGQQTQWLPPWITPLAPAQAPQQQRRRGPAPLAFTPQNAQALPTDGGVQMQAAPAQTDAQLRAPTFNERLEGLYNSPLLNIGLSLLGNAQNGGDWGAVGRDMQAWQQGRRQEQRLRNEERRQSVADQRAETLFGYTREDRERAGQQRQALDQWVATLPAGQQAAARANPAAAHAAYMEAQAMATQPITPFQQAQLGLQRRGLAIDAARAANDMNAQRPLSNIDNRTLNQVTDASDQANAFNMEITRFLSLNAEQPTGAFTQYNPGSWFGDSRNRRDEMEGITSRLISSVRAMSGEGGIMTDADALRFERGLPSVNRAGPVNQNIADAAQQVARNATDRVMFYEMYAQNRGSLLGARSEWNRYLTMNPIYDAQGNLQQNPPGFEEWVRLGSPDLRRAQTSSQRDGDIVIDANGRRVR